MVGPAISFFGTIMRVALLQKVACRRGNSIGLHAMSTRMPAIVPVKGTPEFQRSSNQRKRLEMRFAHLKVHHGFERIPAPLRRAIRIDTS
jgi:hypothetical protein